MRVYIVRHGESETNLTATYTGWMDVALTEKGQEDARRAGAILKGVRFDKIFSSDLHRAMHTAELAIPGCSFETSPMLREVCLGNLEGKPIASLTDADRAVIAQSGYTAFGGESKEEFHGRISGFLQKLSEMEYETVAVFAHGGWLRGMLDQVIGLKLPRDKIYCNNCTVAIIEYTGSHWVLHSWMNLQ